MLHYIERISGWELWSDLTLAVQTLSIFCAPFCIRADLRQGESGRIRSPDQQSSLLTRMTFEM